MALDGAFLRHIKKELKEKLLNSRVDKIYQPSKDEIVLSMRSREGTAKLLLSARANSPRINITEYSPENPKVPPMLCMLLRKRLTGARLRSIRQPELERLIMLDFEGTNELGDIVTMNLAVEIMGKYSNIIFIDNDGNIIDAIKRVDASMSSQRFVLPGIKYEMPPKQNKLCVLTTDADEVVKTIETLPKNTELSKALLSVIQGLSPVVCREIEYLTGRGSDVCSRELNDELRTRLLYFLKKIINTIRDCSGKPYIIIDQTKKPIDFSFEDIYQYGSGKSFEESGGFCKLLDRYYFERDAAERMKYKSEDLNRTISAAAKRLLKKLYVQGDELKSCENREYYRICGDLIQANLYRIPKGASECEVENFYDENFTKISIKLNPALSAAANSQKYYKSYQKAKTAEQMLKVQIKNTEEELDYISSVSDSLSRASTERELNEIRTELTEQGYLKSKGKKPHRETVMPPLEFTSKSGFTVLVGRNNKQNDRLTLKQANKNDIWFHAKDIPGSHTVIITDGKEPDDETILFAAELAAAHSKARDAGKVPIDYTRVRYVSKPQGSKPGMVIYKNQKTIFVEPKNHQ